MVSIAINDFGPGITETPSGSIRNGSLNRSRCADSRITEIDCFAIASGVVSVHRNGITEITANATG